MDTSKEYIEMCRKAEEIQKLDPGYDEEGNYYYQENNPSLPEVGVWSGYSQYEHPMLPEKRIWLPKQDQLQEMVMGTDEYKIVELVDGFHGFCEKDYDYSCASTYEFGVQSESMERLWLAYVMDKKYGKRWNGQDWGKEGE